MYREIIIIRRCLENKSKHENDVFSLSWFFFLLFLCLRSFALLTYEIGILTSGTTLSIINVRRRERRSGEERSVAEGRGGTLEATIRRRRRASLAARISKEETCVVIVGGEERLETPCRQVLALRTGR